MKPVQIDDKAAVGMVVETNNCHFTLHLREEHYISLYTQITIQSYTNKTFEMFQLPIFAIKTYDSSAKKSNAKCSAPMSSTNNIHHHLPASHLNGGTLKISGLPHDDFHRGPRPNPLMSPTGLKPNGSELDSSLPQRLAKFESTND